MELISECNSLSISCLTSSEMKVLDPECPNLGKWNKIVLVSCIIALWVDYMLFFVPWVDAQKLQLTMDRKVAYSFCGVRSLIDVFYVFHIFLRFRTGFIAPHPLFLGDRLVKDSKAITKRYLQSYFMIDILSILPLPQVVTAIVIPTVTSMVQIRSLIILTIAQNLIRFLRMAPLLKEVSVMSGTAWSGAAINFFLYTIASHVAGSLWYLGSIERTYHCWRAACSGHSSCNLGGLFGGDHHGSNSFLISSCLTLESDDAVLLDYGIYLNARSVQLTGYFRSRYFHCFVWGLRNLSSLGQNLETSSGIQENIFVVIISITGLILFSFLASNIQRFLQSLTATADNMRVKIRDREHWMSHTMLPPELKSRVRRHYQGIWVKNRGVDEESLISELPADLRRDIKRYQCGRLLLRVPLFDQLDPRLIEALCCCLKPVLYTADTIIVREGDPVVGMLFIIRGNILTTTTNGGRTSFFNAVGLIPGDFCGEELLTWALDPNSSSSLPISTQTVRAVKDVEAFCLMPEDLKSVASQIRRLHSKQQQQTFRYYLQPWRTWRACFIQAAWRQHCRRKIERELKKAQDGRLQGAILHTPIPAAVYASRFARNMMGNLRCEHRISNLASPKLSILLPEKPSETDFGAEDDPLLRVGEGVSNSTNDSTA